jgi:hypothetical protein
MSFHCAALPGYAELALSLYTSTDHSYAQTATGMAAVSFEAAPARMTVLCTCACPHWQHLGDDECETQSHFQMRILYLNGTLTEYGPGGGKREIGRLTRGQLVLRSQISRAHLHGCLLLIVVHITRAHAHHKLDSPYPPHPPSKCGQTSSWPVCSVGMVSLASIVRWQGYRSKRCLGRHHHAPFE